MEQEKRTLEERIAQAARSQAASPEAAASLVRQLAQMQTALLFRESADLGLMSDLIGPYMERMEGDLLHYAGFCHSINLSFADEAPRPEADTPFRPTMGTRTSSAVVLLGLMLLDHAKGRRRHKEIYHCTRMTLVQYLDALEALAFPEDEESGLRFRRWREPFLKRYAPSAPLADVLEHLLRQYIHGRKALNFLDHVLRCMEGLSSYLEEEKIAKLDRVFRETMRRQIAEMDLTGVEVAEEDEREEYPDPGKHYMDLVNAYSWDVPDLAGESISAEDVRGQIFLPDRDFRPAALRAMAEEAPSPEFRTLLEQLISEQQLSAAMSKVNEAVSCLFMLWVGPYLWMRKRPQ